ncbi:MAG: replication-associated recombination protein A [Clostridia bacterium]|nr:replication-associated recombination protein A [Clostridia bacterium]MBQ5808283.1 replication-associated recombination protein A [Clostridia bacterium]MBR0326812.1 replication-associated recombination protein A [Clostridia bacterium]
MAENRPLADRMRPTSLDMMVGQEHLFGKNGTLRRLIEGGRIGNMIFYGPPGTGKTTAANIIAEMSGLTLRRLNATTASLSDVKDVINDTTGLFGSSGVLLYLDEIQYFNRKQQQVLLEYIEDGRVVLIASTTDNPYYYVYKAVLSRSSVFEFKPVGTDGISVVLRRAWDTLNADRRLSKVASDEALRQIALRGGGDVRRSIGLLENAYFMTDDELSADAARELSANSLGNYDANDDVHYDLLSALQKSIRGSDPDAAIFYLAKLLEGGDLISACRRLQVIASEDIGLAYPMAAAITRACCESAKELGLPEANIPLSHAAILLATAPKSNTAHIAYAAAAEDVHAGKGQEVPKQLQSPMFEGYKYPHDYPGSYVKQQYLPDDVKNNVYYRFGENKTEGAARAYWENIKNK